MKFTKMHGIGNDYVYVNCFEEELAMDPGRLAELVSDRHCGIGSDGLILIKPSAVADFCMDMYNSDGSRGAMCGNGIRCVAKYVYDHGMTNMTTIRIETLSGIKTIDLTVKDGKVRLANVDMGMPVLLSQGVNRELTPEVRKEIADSEIWEVLDVQDKEMSMIHISMGNPHAVFFVDDVDNIEIEKIGPAIETHPRFPDRTNVEFVQIVDESHVKMRVWERGAGETMACGTGACAVAVACRLAGYSQDKVDVRLLGGTLTIFWNPDNGHVEMCGPATEVFTGEFNV
ncbi:diaminopimelate epimerase [Hominifimenecus microfluidus]|uniref:Diaminopimelate epimerase n=1 Tax=Hominifimenecus microfluidus TaxID=2885348 RepID=A0AAE3ECF3_9FIRM|nr:diaminopimelate epimerase [Hominifimenecus microfluidus]MCC2232491.1 diaminopimelate epimerase [Hominifimenecus microfluidus]